MVSIYDAFNNKLLFTFSTKEQALEWIHTEAKHANYGCFRIWEIEGFRFYDLGATVCKISLDELDEGRKS